MINIAFAFIAFIIIVGFALIFFFALFNRLYGVTPEEKEKILEALKELHKKGLIN